MTYREALRYLNSFANYEISGIIRKRFYNLNRIKKLSSAFGDPHKKFKTIHITGTKGKGSTANFIASILAKACFKVGLYTSPHLISERERIRVNGRMIEESELANHVYRIKKELERMGPNFKPSYFEVFTQASFNYFESKGVDFGIFEVGLGGRLDATNIIEPLVVGITPISLEHTEFLGKDLVSIAREKSAIIKAGSACVSSPQRKRVLKVIKNRCKKLNAPLYLVKEHIKVKEVLYDNQKEIFNIDGLLDTYRNCTTKLLGFHQIMNCAAAVCIAEVLKKGRFNIPKKAIIEGIDEARWPGRLEVVRENPYVILDGAQNEESAFCLKETLIRNFTFKRIFTILGFCMDKDMLGVAGQLADISDAFILTRADMPRAAAPDIIEKRIKNVRKPIIKTSCVKEAYKKASRLAKPDDIILAAGSLYTIGELKRFLGV